MPKKLFFHFFQNSLKTLLIVSVVISDTVDDEFSGILAGHEVCHGFEADVDGPFKGPIFTVYCVEKGRISRFS